MDEIVIDDGQVVAMDNGVEQLFAHPNQSDGTARRKVEPAQQFQPSRFGGAVNLGGGIIGRGLAPFFDGASIRSWSGP
jgi:hypothetical protein